MRTFKLYLCTELPPSRIIGFTQRSQYVIVKTTCIRHAFRIFIREILKVKRAYNKEKIKEGYYYYDGAIYIERMTKAKQSISYPDSKIIHTGFFLEICRGCIYSKGKKKDKNKSKDED